MSLFSKVLEEYNEKVKLVTKISKVIILCGSIKDDQLTKSNSSVTMLYKSISKLGIKTYMFNPEKLQFVKSNNKYSLTTSTSSSISISPTNTVIFYRRASPESEKGLNFLQEFESLGFICINTYNAMMNCNNKWLTYTILEKQNIATPKTALINNQMSSDDIKKIAKEQFGNKYPLIVKILDGSKGKGVSIVESERSLTSVIQALLVTNTSGVILQEFIPNDGDYRIHVVNNEIVAYMKREATSSKEFRANISLGGTGKVVEISDEIKQLAINTHSASGCVWSGVDIMIAKDTKKPYVVEINTSPGLVGITEAVKSDIVKSIFNNLQFTHQAETVGIYDTINIVGIGEFSCVLDTGNAKKSMSLDAKVTDIDEEKGKVTYKIDNKTFTDDLVKVVKVKDNSSSDKNADRRPIIKKTVIFRNKEYPEILIDLNDRSHKKYKVLVNLDFIKLAKLKIDVNI